ncbi:helix-turn-helix domain-containing protein [soil metagenome]
MARPIQHPAARDLTLDAILHALSDPIRRKIVRKLMSSDGLNCAGACDALPPSTISFHHNVLREAGIIRSEKKGVSVINRLRRDDLDSRFPGLIDSILSQKD